MFKSAVPVLAALDVEAATSFWTDRLGFRVLFHADGFAGVSRDAVTFYICSVDEQVVADNTQAWIIVESVDSLFDEWSPELGTAYADVSQPAVSAIVERPWGREFTVRDVAGNGVHFMSVAG